MTYPLIGVTAAMSRRPSGYEVINTGNSYVQAVRRAGGLPMLLPVTLPEGDLTALIAQLDGLLLTGGGDIDPARFDDQMHPRVEGIDLVRDDAEILLVQQAAARGLPFLGICRGIQIINVAFGGTLYTDIADQLPGALYHPWVEGNPRDHLAHTVRFQPGTMLGALASDEETPVNSLHHQGIKAIADGLIPAARSSDGLVEAVELRGHPFGVGVQWHPEELNDHPVMQRLFREFVRVSDGLD